MTVVQDDCASLRFTRWPSGFEAHAFARTPAGRRTCTGMSRDRFTQRAAQRYRRQARALLCAWRMGIPSAVLTAGRGLGRRTLIPSFAELEVDGAKADAEADVHAQPQPEDADVAGRVEHGAVHKGEELGEGVHQVADAPMLRTRLLDGLPNLLLQRRLHLWPAVSIRAAALRKSDRRDLKPGQCAGQIEQRRVAYQRPARCNRLVESRGAEAEGGTHALGFLKRITQRDDALVSVCDAADAGELVCSAAREVWQEPVDVLLGVGGISEVLRDALEVGVHAE